MFTSKRFWALCALGAISAAAACDDKDQTDVCVGPTCPQYDGIGGNFFRSNDPSITSEAGSAGEDSAGSAGENAGGSAGENAGGSAGENAGGSAGEDSAGSAGASGASGDLPDAGDNRPDSGPTPPACELAFVTPVVGDAGALTLDGASDVDAEACGSEFTIAVALASNAKSITLFVNDAPLSTQDLVDGAVNFDAVLGNRGTTPNVLRAEATMADNRTCSLEFPSSILVDCPGPSCSIDAPIANDDGYLNGSQDSDQLASGFQTDIVVSTEVENQGQHVRLAIDGTFDTVPAADVTDDNGTGSASFSSVTLAEGPRTVRAECSDAFGVTTLSAPAAFNVDTTPCGISISSLAGGADPITPSSDQDHDGGNGIQVLADGQITGGDCKTLWIGVCGGPLAPLPLNNLGQNGNFSLPVTLVGSTGSLDVCGKVEDFAGNLSAEDQVTVHLRLEAPQVSIASPAPNTRYNALGTSGAVADGDTGSSACDAAVVVSCSENGVLVDLLGDGSLIGQATCTGGQASFNAVLPSKNDGAATQLTARQTITGFAPVVSTGVSVLADCEAPTCTVSSPDTNLSFLNASNDSALGNPGFQISFGVASDANSSGQNATLIIDGDANNALTTALVTQGGGSGATFADVLLAEGPHSVLFQCADAAGNVGNSATAHWTVDTIPCSSSLVVAGGVSPITPVNSPGLQVTATGQTTGGDCTTARVGVCGSLGSTSFTPLDVGGVFSLNTTLPNLTGPADVCLEVSDAAGNVGSVPTTVAVRVDLPVVAITSPQNGAAFNVASSCAQDIEASCSDVGADVLLLVDGVLTDTQQCQLGNTVTFPQITLPTKNDGSPTTLAVQQTADGLTSAASSISVQADCQNPTAPSITAPACGGVLALPDDDLDLGTAGVNVNVDVANGGLPLVDLTITRGALITGSQLDGGVGATTTTFPSLDLGGPGNIGLVACVTDSAGNKTCSPSCDLLIANHPTLSITSPTDLTQLTSANDCDINTAGLQVTVQGTTDAAAGSPVQLRIGSGALKTATADGTGFSDCVDAPESHDPETLTATVLDQVTNLSTSASLGVAVDSVGPNAIAAPTFTVLARREGTVQLNWNSTVDSDGDSLLAYQLRCALTSITTESAWTAATSIPVNSLPAATAGVAESEVFTGFKTGMTRFCVMRGEDAFGQLSPLSLAVNATVSNPFLTQAYSVVDDPNTPAAQVRRVDVEPLGDINGDGFPDFAYGATQRKVQVFLGKTLPTTQAIPPGPAEVPSFEISFNNSATNTVGFGSEIASLGDINGDTIPDFAVGAPAANMVFVFFGRASNTWSSFSVDSNAGNGCEASVCIVGSALGGTTNGLFGWDVHSVDMDGVAPNDLAIGARTANTNGQVFVLLGGASRFVSGTTLTVTNTALGSNPDGFLISAPASRNDFGFSVGSVPSGLLIGAAGQGTTGGNPGAIYFVPPQTPSASGMTALTSPTVVEIGNGTGTQFGVPVRAVGDYDGDGQDDFASAESFNNVIGGIPTVYRGSASGFSISAKLSFTNNSSPFVDDNWGTFIADGWLPGLGAVGDLDGDGFGDLLIGATVPDSPSGSVGSAQLFYGATGAAGRNRVPADFTYTSTLSSGQVMPNYVGDINKDGFNDLAVLDSGAGGNVVILLY